MTDIVLSDKDKALERLSERERIAYNDWQENKNKPPLAPSLSAKLYNLFLNGYDCHEIVRLNEGLYSLGMVLEARVRDGWDQRRHDYLESLFSSVEDKAKQTQAESVMFLTDLMAATHKHYGDKLKKYIQSGDINDLGDMRLDSPGAYKKVVEMFLKLTGQDGGGQAPAPPGMHVVSQNTIIQQTPAKEMGPDPNDAKAMLRFLNASDEEKK